MYLELHVVRQALVFDTANHFLLPSLIIEPLPTLYYFPWITQ